MIALFFDLSLVAEVSDCNTNRYNLNSGFKGVHGVEILINVVVTFESLSVCLSQPLAMAKTCVPSNLTKCATHALVDEALQIYLGTLATE